MAAFNVEGGLTQNAKSQEAADIIAAGKAARLLDPSLAKQESEGLKGPNMAFRPEDISLAGVGDIEITRTKGGNFTQEITEDPRTGEFRDQLLGGAEGAFDTAASLQPEVAGSAGDATGAARGIFDAQGSFDPMVAAQERFDKLDSILAPARERERSGLESRLFNQGRLESSAGSRELGDYNAAIERERAGMLDRQFGEAQNAQINQLNTAGSLTGVGSAVQGGIFNQGLQGVGGSQQLSEPMLRLMGLANDQGVATSNSKLGIQTLKAQEDAEDSGGFMDGPWGKLIGAGITGAATAFGGPIGGMAAGAVMGRVTAPSGAAPSTSPNGAGALDMSSFGR